MASLAEIAMPMTVHPDADTMAERLAATLRDDLARTLAQKGEAVIAVSGGSTPAALYRKLADARLDWSRVTIVLVDERWVDPGEPGSNQTFVEQTLLSGQASKARFIGLKTAAETPLDGVEEVEARLADTGKPDIVILGMGPDGHTASWFPRAQGLDQALSRNGAMVAAVKADETDVTGRHTQRMTLTLGAIADASRILLMIAGAAKRDALERALQDGPVADLPVRAVLRARDLPLDIHWTD